MKLLYIFALSLLFNYFILIAIYRYLFSLSGGYLMFPHFTLSGTAYQALHRKLTLFCTCVTQIILLALAPPDAITGMDTFSAIILVSSR